MGSLSKSYETSPAIRWRNGQDTTSRKTCNRQVVRSTPGRFAWTTGLVTTWMGECLQKQVNYHGMVYNWPPRITQSSIRSRYANQINVASWLG